MKVAIVCSGTVENYDSIKHFFDDVDYIISVDGGASHLKQMGIKPDILVGDFDSVCSEDYFYFVNQGIEVSKYPAEKDMTDSELAVELAVAKGANEIVFIGALGTRMDHSISNILMLRTLVEKDIRAYIVNEKNEIYMCRNQITIPKKEGSRLSLIPVTAEVKGVTTKGLKYPLKDANMKLGTSWGVSNEFVWDEATVRVAEGILLVIVSCD